MDQQPWWIIIVAPAATIIAVVVERIFTFLTAKQQANDALGREQRQLYVELLKAEVVPVLDFIDRVARAASQMSLEFSAFERNAAPDVYEELIKDASIARVRARSISGSLGDRLDAIMDDFGTLGMICQREEEPLMDASAAQAKKILVACGLARAETREAITTILETGQRT